MEIKKDNCIKYNEDLTGKINLIAAIVKLIITCIELYIKFNS